MAITNAEVIRYSNEVLRPLAEKMQWLKLFVNDALDQWDLIQASVPDRADQALEDNRRGEGVREINGQDIRRVIAVLNSYKTMMEAAGVARHLRKPSVRGIDIALRV